MNAPTIRPTPLAGLQLVQPKCFADDRGFFMESWNEREYADAGLAVTFVQDSHSRSRRGVLRGLHFQAGHVPLAKLVRCTVGEIFDVAVDIRAGSPTFGRWFAVRLSAENKLQMYLPEGFAHGLLALSDVAEVQYKQTGPYVPSAERAIAWNDPDLAIDWPTSDPILSARDHRAESFRDYVSRPAFTWSEAGQVTGARTPR